MVEEGNGCAVENRINWLESTQASIESCLAGFGMEERSSLLLDKIDNIFPLSRIKNLLKTEEA